MHRMSNNTNSSIKNDTQLCFIIKRRSLIILRKSLCICFAILCFTAGMLPLILKGMNAGNIALVIYSLMLTAVVFIKGGRGRNKLMSFVYWARVCVSCILVICFITAFIISVFMLKYAYFNKPPANMDGTVVVLGCHVNGDSPSRLLKGRLDAAIKYMNENKNIIAVVSGGQGENEDLPEAHVMKKYMIENGIDAGRIVLEDKSVSTDENIRFSADIIHENELPDTFFIVTDVFHSYRGFLFAGSNGYKAYNISADIYWPLIGEYWVRDILGILHMKLTPGWDLSPRH